MGVDLLLRVARRLQGGHQRPLVLLGVLRGLLRVGVRAGTPREVDHHVVLEGVRLLHTARREHLADAEDDLVGTEDHLALLVDEGLAADDLGQAHDGVLGVDVPAVGGGVRERAFRHAEL